MVKVEVRDQTFDPWGKIGRHQEAVLSRGRRFGATAVFVKPERVLATVNQLL